MVGQQVWRARRGLQMSKGKLCGRVAVAASAGVVAMAGVAVAGTHVVAATRAWIEELETPPGQLARLRWEQAKTATAAGAATWREHPNAQVRLVRRASSASN